MKTGLVFGTFDGLHEGHLHFLRSAKEHCDKLVVSLPNDDLVVIYKGRRPIHPYGERLEALMKSGIIDKVVPSDESSESFTIINREKPSIIILGYDQTALHDSLMHYLSTSGLHVEVLVLKSHEPHRFKSSLLNHYD